MHILVLAASALLAGPAPAPAADTVPVEHRVSIFQQDFPISHQDGRREYERFVARDLFDESGRPRTFGLKGCSQSCDYAELRTAGDTDVQLVQGEMTPTETAGGIVDLLNGRKAVVSYAGGKGEIRIEDHHIDQAAGTTGTPAYTVMKKGFSTRRDDWSYYRTFSQKGEPVMRLLVVWENTPRIAAN